MGSMARGCPRCGELEETIERLREANRRLQVQGPAIERDKLIVELRAALALQAQERLQIVGKLKFWHEQLADSPKSFYANVGTLIADLMALPSAAAPVTKP